MTAQSTELIYLELKYLKMHPRNMRRFYPEEQVRELADSIRANNGVIHALQIVPHKDEGTYLVIDGNMRLHAGRLLGPKCPPLKCEVISVERGEQLLRMVTDRIRFDPDPVSEALHYKALCMDEGLGVNEIAERTGKHATSIRTRLDLLRLDEPILERIAQGKLPVDHHVVDALLKIADKDIRIKLAERLSESGASIKGIVEACTKVAEQLALTERAENGTPAVVLAVRQARKPEPQPEAQTSWNRVRAAASRMCNACDLKEKSLTDISEPAWQLIAHAAEQTCGDCKVKNIHTVCKACPGVEMLKHLIISSKEERHVERTRA